MNEKRTNKQSDEPHHIVCSEWCGCVIPLNSNKAPKKTSKAKHAQVALKLVLAFVSTVSLILALAPVKRVSAWEGAIPACSVDYNSFAWKSAIKNHANNTQQIDPETASKVLVYKYVGMASTEFQVDLVQSPKIAKFTQGATNPVTSKTTKSVTHQQLAGSNNLGTSWTVSTSTKTVTNTGTIAVDPATPNKNGTEGTGNSTDLTCISTAKGYETPFNWDQVTVSETLPAEGSQKCNGALDFGCWIGKAFNGIGDGFNAVAQAILKGIAFLWAPDQAQTQAQFTTLNDFLQAKLGFLVYPITFVVDMFNGFNDTSNNWCTASSCSKNFGNFQGKPFNVDFNTGATVYPGIWDFFLAAIRGATVLGLVFAIRHKYLEIVNK